MTERLHRFKFFLISQALTGKMADHGEKAGHLWTDYTEGSPGPWPIPQLSSQPTTMDQLVPAGLRERKSVALYPGVLLLGICQSCLHQINKLPRSKTCRQCWGQVHLEGL